jgi:hypothetical protein
MIAARGGFRSASFVRGVGLSMIALLLTSSAASAADCEVNVFNAYTTALKRGWKFQCGPSLPGSEPKFATYPPTTIGCSWTTPPVSPAFVIRGYMFGRNHNALDRRALHNGWTVKSYEISGKQYTRDEDDGWRVAFVTTPVVPNTTYNVKISRLVLSKSGGSCAKAIDEAF